ncbi:c-type cytochrome [Salipiger sp. IMCC34102]|uniref:c-type cytochrome n=1 Tax=Salipiger sp. IMCC34102 TaxID=2510647 RepID=UPI00101C934A|nr:c-type cytochrome [Salipiger sp. IMCC34102]RYH04534.1 c-type cytochrome [Salipiger sp. IMCC34102]
MKRVIQTLAVLAAVAALAGAAVVLGGLYNVSARAGHWPGVPFVLHTTYEQSVDLRAPSEAEVPDLKAPGMVALGAKHFDESCRMCHAAPGLERWAIPQVMVPEPPHITRAVAGWTAAELHWIVDEGVKMSGMPHWPAARIDDVWPVVAFLRQVEEMSATDYADLTRQPARPEGAPDALPYCATCHGITGRSDNPQIPRLDIQDRDYLEQALRAYADGSRDSGIMHVAATRVPRAQLADLAAWFADQPVDTAPAAPVLDEGLAEDGAVLARAGTTEIPACVACHGPGVARKDETFPRLAGQSQIYLAQQLRLWRDGVRGDGRQSDLMVKAAEDLTDDDIAALAAWYASLPAEAR